MRAFAILSVLVACTPCDELSFDDCSSDSSCTVIKGQRLNVDQMCTVPAEAIACEDKSAGCTTAVTFASDPAGERWMFADSCIPSGWKKASAPNNAIEWAMCKAAR